MTKVDVEKIRVVGIAARTSYRLENSTKAKIPHLWKRLGKENILSKIPNKVNPEKLYAVYTEYESDEFGAYTFILGVEVSEFSNIPEGMIGKTIQKSNYEMKESDEGPFKEVVPKAWKSLSKDTNLKERRKFETDFETYDANENEDSGKVRLYVGVA